MVPSMAKPGTRSDASGPREVSKAGSFDVPEYNTQTPEIQAPRGSHREAADDYLRIICHLSRTVRIIICRDELQYIVQVRDGKRAGAPRWTGKRYCQTREGLIAACRALCAAPDPDAMVMVESLPDLPVKGGAV